MLIAGDGGTVSLSCPVTTTITPTSTILTAIEATHLTLRLVGAKDLIHLAERGERVIQDGRIELRVAHVNADRHPHTVLDPIEAVRGFKQYCVQLPLPRFAAPYR